MLLNNLNCNGHEKSLSDCDIRTKENVACHHNEDAGVECFQPPKPVRLVNGINSTTGRLEILYKNEWGTICDDEFTNIEAKVVCSQLG